MLPIQRRQALQEYIASNGGSSIRALSEQFGVSEMTIRRDLEKLEEQGRVLRSHGGVVDVSVPLGEPLLPQKLARHPNVKERLAAYASSHFVASGDVIIMEGGTTVSRMASYLQQEQLTILTNGLDTLQQLRATSDRHTVLSCGGTLRETSGTFVGPVAESFFSQFHANTAFLSSLSFSEEVGFTDPNLLDTQVKKMMMGAAERVVMLLDSSKFGRRSFAAVARLEQVHALVTDTGVPERIKEACHESGVELHIV